MSGWIEEDLGDQVEVEGSPDTEWKKLEEGEELFGWVVRTEVDKDSGSYGDVTVIVIESPEGVVARYAIIHAYQKNWLKANAPKMVPGRRVYAKRIVSYSAGTFAYEHKVGVIAEPKAAEYAAGKHAAGSAGSDDVEDVEL